MFTFENDTKIDASMDIPTQISSVRSRSLNTVPYSDSIPIDPGKQLTVVQREAFLKINKKYDSVFNPNFTGYNDYSGPIRAKITLGAVPPPPQKAKLPFYKQANLQLLQNKADELEDKGVLVTPESVNLTPIHISPSFLVKKPNGDWRYVAAFNDILVSFVAYPHLRLPNATTSYEKWVHSSMSSRAT